MMSIPDLYERIHPTCREIDIEEAAYLIPFRQKSSDVLQQQSNEGVQAEGLPETQRG